MQPNQGPQDPNQMHQQRQRPVSPAPHSASAVVQQESNTLAIVGLILAFVFWPAGLLVSIMGLKKAKELGGSGHGLAMAGTILSAIFGLLVIALVVLGAVAGDIESDTTALIGL